MINELLGAMIKNRRIELGYNHADLERLFRISKRSITSLENGEIIKYREVTINKVSEALNLDRRKIWGLIEQC